MMCRFADRFYFEEGSETSDGVVEIAERCAGLPDEVISFAIALFLARADACITDEERARRVDVFCGSREKARRYIELLMRIKGAPHSRDYVRCRLQFYSTLNASWRSRHLGLIRQERRRVDGRCNSRWQRDLLFRTARR